MESYDVEGADLERWRASRLSSDRVRSELLLVAPDQMEPIADLVRAMHAEVNDPDSELSRRQIEHHARRMRRHAFADDSLELGVCDLLPAIDRYEVPGLSLRQKLFHVAALWDYLE